MQTPSHCPDYCVETLRGSTCFHLAGPYIITFVILNICIYNMLYTYTHAPADNLIQAHLKCYSAHILTRQAKITYAVHRFGFRFLKNKVFSKPSKVPTRLLLYQFERTALGSRRNKLQQELYFCL